MADDRGLSRLGVGDELRTLLGRYCDLMDAGDFDGVGGLFADGRLATEDGGVLAAGSSAVAAFYRAGTQLHGDPPSPRTKHLVTNTQLSSSADGSSAEARSSYLVLQAVDGALSLQPIITGRYVDTFTRAAGAEAWTWKERRFTVDLVGDLSSHLTYGIDAPRTPRVP